MAEATLLSRIRELEERLAALEGGYSPAPDLVFNVLAFGADRSGATETTSHVQAALTAAKAAGGGRVYLPAGTYLVDALALADADYITICGDGPGRTILRMKPNAANAPILEFIACNRLTVRDLEIDGDKAHQTGRYIRGLRWRASTAASGGVLCEHGTFENLYIHDVPESGLVIAGGRWAKISKVHTERCGSTGNIGAGIHISNDFPDTSLLSCDVQISDCSDDGSGLDEGDEGAGLQLQVNTHDIQVSNYTSRDGQKYGVKCQAHNVDLCNVQVYEPGVCGISLQYNDVRAANLRVEKTTESSVEGINIEAPQQGSDPRDIRMSLSNVFLVGDGFYSGLSIENTGSETDPVAHVQVNNLQIKGGAGLNYGLRLRGNVRDCQINGGYISDCDTNISVTAATIGETAYSPENIEFRGVHSKELTAGASGSIGWSLLYGSGLLDGCTSTRLAGSSRTLWAGHNQNWGVSNAHGVAGFHTIHETIPTRVIADGALAAGNAAYMEVHPESGSSDTLTDITGGTVGQMLVLKADGGDTITLTHNAAKIILPGGVDYTLSGDKRLLLYCIAPGKWTVFNA